MITATLPARPQQASANKPQVSMRPLRLSLAGGRRRSPLQRQKPRPLLVPELPAVQRPEKHGQADRKPDRHVSDKVRESTFQGLNLSSGYGFLAPTVITRPSAVGSMEYDLR